MPKLVVEWLIPNHVIYTEMHGDMDLEAFQEFDGLVSELLEQATGTAHVISGIAQMGGIKANPKKIQSAVTHIKNPKLGWVVMYGGATLVRYVASVVFQLSGSNMRAFSTYEDCARFLGSLDENFAIEDLLAAREPAL